MAKKKSNQTNTLLSAVLYILIGVLFCVFRAGVLNWAMTAIGAVLVIVGILKVAKNAVAEGVFTAALGVLVILGGWMFLDIILLVLGVALAVMGVFDLIKALDGKKKNTSAILASVITVAAGILLIVSRWALLDWFIIALGVILIIDGVLMLAGKK